MTDLDDPTEPSTIRRSCTECGHVFESVRLDARYCSGRCRQRAHRRRTGALSTREYVNQNDQKARRAITAAIRNLRIFHELTESDRFARENDFISGRLERYYGLSVQQVLDLAEKIRHDYPVPERMAHLSHDEGLGIVTNHTWRTR